MYSVGAFFGTLVVQLPILAVLALGFVLLSAPGRRLPGRAGVLAKAGLGLILANSIGSMVWSLALPQLVVRADFGPGMVRNIGIASTLVGFLLSAVFAAGLGLLVAALAAARRGGDPSPPGPGSPGPHYAGFTEPPPGPPSSGPVPPGPVPPGPVPPGPVPPGPIPPA